MFVLMKSDELKMGNVWSKTRSRGHIKEKPYVHSRGHIFCPIIMKHGQNICLNESLDEYKNAGHVGSKTRSISEILEKPCVRYRGHIFSLIIMELSQNCCFDEILHELKNGSCWVKN